MTAKEGLVEPGKTAASAEAPPSERGGPEKDKPAGKALSASQLALGLFFGILFGFLLQKGGVAKYHILIGMLLLEDFTVVKVMMTAIVVGSIGIFGLYALGLVKLHIKPTRYAANILGGLLFGVGFGLMGYCPGTGAAALGQGNLDAIGGVLGLMAGSYLFAEMSGVLGKTVLKWGDRGNLMLPELLGMQLRTFLFLFLPMLVVILVAVEKYAAR